MIQEQPEKPIPSDELEALAWLRPLLRQDAQTLRAWDAVEFTRAWSAIAFLYDDLHPDSALDHGENIGVARKSDGSEIASLEPELAAPYFEKSGWPVILAPVAEAAWSRYESGEIRDDEFYFFEAQTAGFSFRNERSNALMNALMITHLSPTPELIGKYENGDVETRNLLDHEHIMSKINSSKEERRSWARMNYIDEPEIFEALYKKPSFCFKNWETDYKVWFFIYKEVKFTATTSEEGTSYSIILENEEEFDSKIIGEKCVGFVEKMGMIRDTYRLGKIELSPEKRAEFLTFAYNLFEKEGKW